MKTNLLITISIIAGIAISLPFVLDGFRFLPQYYEDSLRYEIETDFMNKIREAGDDSEPMSLTVISKQDPFTLHENYCGHAHMDVEEYWYFADTYNDVLLSSIVIQNISSWCEDDNDNCYCKLRESIGVDRRSYEDFFRMHVSETCPVTPIPKTATSFDPTTCKWIEKEEPSLWVSLPVTSCGYQWHESNHEKTKQYYVEYTSVFGNYDSSDPLESAEAMHYVITRYYEDLGKDILDVRTIHDPSMASVGEGCNTMVGGTWHLKIQNTDLGYFLDDGYTNLFDNWENKTHDSKSFS